MKKNELSLKNAIVFFCLIIPFGSFSQLKVISNGSVGIGQSSPTAKLDVLNTNGNYGFKVGLGGSDPLVSIWQTSSTPRSSLIYENGAFEIYNAAGYTSEFYVNTSGKVGIGTNSPNSSYKLTVIGSALASGGTWTNSDKRYKKNIQTIENALDKIKKLNGVSYEFQTEKFKEMSFNSGKSLGFIAQELNEVLPEAVRIDNEGYYAVNYDEIIPVLVEALKEQNKKIEQMQKDITNCCSTNDKMSNSSAPTINDNPYSGSSFIKQNSPNPFSKETTIEYFISEKSAASSILIFDMNGKLLKTFKLETEGKGAVIISRNDFSPGMYYYSLTINSNEVATKKMILSE